MERHDGLLTFYMDRRKGRLWLETPPADKTGRIGRYLYVEGLVTGLGSNDVGLDRGQVGPTRVVELRRVGGRLIVEALNLRFRALSDNPHERRAVTQSFATSILWAGEMEVQQADGRALVDFTSFIVRDAHHVANRLKRTGQGTYTLDKKRSMLDPPQCVALPVNVEFEALLTFGSNQPGRLVASTASDGRAVTLRQHHSLLRLPPDGYRVRRFDPRASSFPTTFINYAAPLSQPLEVRWIARHRLEKIDPHAPRSRAKEPIVYYVDRGAPEPVRSALIEGASWWDEAFEAAGFIDAFQVELLPEGVHPLDARYNLIQWVHRSTRGWSYGGSVTDPRTGEIVKGHVSLGSLRVRQDRLLFEGLLGTDQTGTGRPDDPIQLALARIRQLAAHEVGHTLGFTHNFAASTYSDRASVMDYPAPRVAITEDRRLDCTDAYGVGVGAWDKFAVAYAYSEYPTDREEDAALSALIETRLRDGLRFITDADARPAGAAHPTANLWDNGDDVVASLEYALRVRRIALDRFGERNVQPGQPLAKLHEVLVPVYLYHRYQLAAAVKVLGGLDYRYAMRGDGQPPMTPIDPATQQRALTAVLECIAPRQLDLPDSILEQVAPRPFGYRRNREMFSGDTGLILDPLSAAAIAADLAISGLLNPRRCARLVDQHRRNEGLPSLETVLQSLTDAAFATLTTREPDGGVDVGRGSGPDERTEEIRRAVQRIVVARLIGLSANKTAPGSVRSRVDFALATIRGVLAKDVGTQPAQRAHRMHLAGQITRYLERPYQPSPIPTAAPPPPPGSPIGMDGVECRMANDE